MKYQILYVPIEDGEKSMVEAAGSDHQAMSIPYLKNRIQEMEAELLSHIESETERSDKAWADGQRAQEKRQRLTNDLDGYRRVLEAELRKGND